MFSSPGKQAQQAAAATGAMSSQEISQLQQYDQQQRQQLRDALSGMGANPYFAAGAQMNPANYRINPADTVGYSSQGPGTMSVTPNYPAQANPYPVPSSTNPQPKPGQQPTPLPGQPIQPTPPTPGNPPVTTGPIQRPDPIGPIGGQNPPKTSPTGPGPRLLPLAQTAKPDVITVNPGMGPKGIPGKAMQ